MVFKSIWLVHHKASLGEYSPMNLDGSTFMRGVGVVPASTMKEALALFDAYLHDKEMGLLELWKCEQWDPKAHNSGSMEDEQINHAASKALETNLIHYTCGISSEALDCEGD